MFICNNIKVSNYQCHYHPSTPHPTPKSLQNQPKIHVYTKHNSPNNQSHNPSAQKPCPPITILQKIKHKNQSLATTLMCTQNRKRGLTTSTIKDSRDSFLLDKALNIKGRTFATHEIVSEEQSSQEEEKKIRFEESTIIQRNLQGQFKEIKRTLRHKDYEEIIAVENSLGLIVSLKKVPLKNNYSIVQEISVYGKISQHENILSLYQVLQDKQSQIFVKEPYRSIITSGSDIPEILRQITKALKYLENEGIFMDQLEPSDIRYCLGTWKLANLSKNIDIKFKQPIPISHNISCLEQSLINIFAKGSMRGSERGSERGSARISIKSRNSMMRSRFNYSDKKFF